MEELPKLGPGNLIKQINIWVDPDLRSMYDDLRKHRVNVSEIGRRAMRKAFQDALEQIQNEQAG